MQARHVFRSSFYQPRGCKSRVCHNISCHLSCEPNMASASAATACFSVVRSSLAVPRMISRVHVFSLAAFVSLVARCRLTGPRSPSLLHCGAPLLMTRALNCCWRRSCFAQPDFHQQDAEDSAVATHRRGFGLVYGEGQTGHRTRGVRSRYGRV